MSLIIACSWANALYSTAYLCLTDGAVLVVPVREEIAVSRTRHWYVWYALVVLTVSLASCGATSAAEPVYPTPTPTATLASAPPATATPTATSSLTETCGPTSNSAGAAMVTVGDLQALMQLGGLSYPARKLPDGLPLAPFKLQMSSPAALDAQLPPNPLTDPSMTEPQGGYWLSICDTSPTQAHTLDQVSVQIASFTPYGGHLNEWDSGDTKCGTVYARPQGVSGGGCGGAVGGAACFHATFAEGDGVGSSVSAPFTSAIGCLTGGTLPLPLPHGQGLNFALGITQPRAPGTYTFTIRLVTDAGTLTFVPTAPVLLAPVAHKWSGDACTAAAMQAQIPQATDPPTTYICPA